jgi:uncharacterized membrane protein
MPLSTYLDAQSVKAIVEISAAILMLVGVGLFFVNREKQQRGLSVVAVQFVAIVLVLPIILILSLEEIFKGETAAAILGTLSGYLFAELAKRSPSRKPPTSNNPGKSGGAET